MSETPLSLAREFAYLGDASTIRVRVMEHFGTAPKRDVIEQIVAERKAKFHEGIKLCCEDCGKVLNRAARDQAICYICKRARRVAAEKRAARERAEAKRTAEKLAAAKAEAERAARRAAILAGQAPARPMPAGPVSQAVWAAEHIFGVSEAEIVGDARRGPVVRARQAAMYVAVEWGKCSTSTVGRMLDRDHTTIIYGRRAVVNRMAREPNYADQIARMIAMLPVRTEAVAA